MNNELVMRYDAIKTEIDNNLKILNNIGVDIDSYKTTIQNINDNLKADLKKAKKLQREHSIDTTYELAILKLKELNSCILNDYEKKFKIHVTYKNLKNKINMINSDNHGEISEIITELINLLEDIKSSIVDIELEKNFIEKVYNLVYKMIKLEFIYSKTSTLFDYVDKDDVDTYYIVKCIKSDIEEVSRIKNSTSLSNDLEDAVARIEKQGLNSANYFDKNLIFLLCMIDESKFYQESKSILLEKIDDFVEKSKELTTLNEEKEELKSLKKQKRINSFKIIKKRIITLANLALMSFLTLHSINILKDLTSDKIYKTTKTIYDTSNPDTPLTIEYLDKMEDALDLKEYSAWEEPGYFRDEYSRNVYTYKIDESLELDNLVDYLSEDLKELVVASESEKQTSSEKPEDIDDGRKYVITKVEQDKNDFQKVVNKKLWFATIISEDIILLIISNLIISSFSKSSMNDLKIYKRELNNQLVVKKHLKNSEEIKALYNQLKEEIAKSYECLPHSLHQDPTIKEKYLSYQEEVQKNESK